MPRKYFSLFGDGDGDSDGHPPSWPPLFVGQSLIIVDDGTKRELLRAKLSTAVAVAAVPMIDGPKRAEMAKTRQICDAKNKCE